MKPIRGAALGVLTSLVVLCGLGYAASQVPGPTSEAVALAAANEPTVAHSGEQANSLEVTITGIRNDRGVLMVAVFDDAEAFEAYDYERSIDFREAEAGRAVDGALRLSFPHLTDGPYAVSLFHDENTDGDFNTLNEVPLEGYGTSGARNAYHEPTFAEAAVQGSDVRINLFYW